MKTTIELSEPIYRQLKARAALKGQSMKSFVAEAIQEKLARTAREEKGAGWEAVFGKAPEGCLDEVQERIDHEFSQIEPQSWE